MRLFLATKATYEATGIDIRYETEVTGVHAGNHTISVRGDGTTSYDKLIICTGFDYAPVGVPGADLDGLYYVKNIRRAMEWTRCSTGQGRRRGRGISARPCGLAIMRGNSPASAASHDRRVSAGTSAGPASRAGGSWPEPPARPAPEPCPDIAPLTQSCLLF